jgi:inositol phosphorylceramide mannosyltransferase catalytic subunit
MNTLDLKDLDTYLLSQKGRIIHQVWFGTIPNKKEAAKTYDKFKIYRDSWKIKNPTWCHMEWSKKLSEQITKAFFTEHWDLYKKYPYEIQRCDMVRYFCLYRYGGIYADMDYYCNKSFDDAFTHFNNDFYLVNTPNVGNSYVSNSLMYSKPGHVFWRRLFLEMEMSQECPIYYSRHLIIMYTTGPGILTRVYNANKIKDRLKSLPYNLFHPHGISDNIMSLRNDKVYAIHLGKGSWEKNDSKIFIYFYREWRFIFFIVLVLILPLLIYSIFIGKQP